MLKGASWEIKHFFQEEPTLLSFLSHSFSHIFMLRTDVQMWNSVEFFKADVDLDPCKARHICVDEPVW